MDLKSKSKLETCAYGIVRVIEEVDKRWPGGVSVIEGRRSKERQDQLYAEGKSKLRWPEGKHCSDPSRAVDIAPTSPDGSVDWNNTRRFYFFAGYVMGVAAMLGEKFRSGADWDGDGETNDQTFNDLVHFESEGE